MTIEPTLLERAFALAHSGRFHSVTEIRNVLRLEGWQYVDLSRITPAVGRQLGKIIAQARPELVLERAQARKSAGRPAE